jgi:hypothetical protein
MTIKQDFQKQVEGQLAVWQAQVTDHQERLAKAGADARADQEKVIVSLRESAGQAKKLLGQIQEAGEGAWNDMQAASQRAFEQLQKGWADALTRFA